MYVANLPFSVDEEGLKATFASAGSISAVDWLTHSDTGRFKGAVFLTFESGAAAAAATALNGQDNGGRPMKVELASSRPQGEKKAWEPTEQGEPSASLYVECSLYALVSLYIATSLTIASARPTGRTSMAARRYTVLLAVAGPRHASRSSRTIASTRPTCWTI